jgi:predicted nuclease with TOPRIM domain
MELTLADIEQLMKPIYTILESIDKRMAELETSQKELSNELKRSTDRYHELDKKIAEVDSELAGFVERYRREHELLDNAVKKNYSDLTLEIQKCKPETLEESSDKKTTRASNKLNFWLKVGGLILIILMGFAVVITTLYDRGLIIRQGTKITLPETRSEPHSSASSSSSSSRGER